MSINELMDEAKSKIRKLHDQTEDKFCDGCYYLKIQKPPTGPRGCNIDPWRDSYKCRCDYFNILRLSGSGKKIPKCIECLMSNVKEVYTDGGK